MNSKLVLDGYCFVCGGSGFADKDCPSCGREAKIKSLNLDMRVDAEEFVTQTGMTVVPEHYRGVIWNSELLKSSKADKSHDINFQKFVDGLEAVNRVFSRGVLSSQAAIIIAPAGLSKMTEPL